MPSEFAEQRIRLTAAMDAQIEGPYRCGHLPWLRTWHDLRRSSPGKKGVIAPKPAQTALTQGANNQILARLASENGNIIYLMGREEDAERIAKKRFAPQIRDIPELRARFEGYASSARMTDTATLDGVQEGGFEFAYDGGTVYFRTGRTAASVATIPAGDVTIDEYDLLEKAFAGSKSGKLWEFALGRQAAIIGGDTWVSAFSHPTEWTRGIGKLFRDVSDQGTWVFDCPRCGAPIAPSLRDINFRTQFAEGRNDPRSAWLACPACGDAITEAERIAGVWERGTGPGAGGSGRLHSPLPENEARAREYAGFWVKGLMNPWKSIEHFARLLCGATDEESRQAVHNVHGGEPYEAVSETLTPAAVGGIFEARQRLGVGCAPGSAGGVKGVQACAIDDGWLSGQVKDACREMVFSGTSGGVVQLLPVRNASRVSSAESATGLNQDTPYLLRSDRKRTDPSRPHLGMLWAYDLHRHTWWDRIYQLITAGRWHVTADLAEGIWGDLNRTPIDRDLPTKSELIGQLTAQVLVPVKAQHGWQQGQERMEWDKAKDRRDDWHAAKAYALAGAIARLNLGLVHLMDPGVQIVSAGADVQSPQSNPTIYLAVIAVTGGPEHAGGGHYFCTHLRLCRGFAAWRMALAEIGVKMVGGEVRPVEGKPAAEARGRRFWGERRRGWFSS